MPHILTSLLVTPVAGLAVLLCVPGRNRRALRLVAIGASLLTLVLALILLRAFQPDAAGFQFAERIPWVPSLGIDYSLGVDGISLLLVLLSAVILPLALLASWTIEERLKEFFALFLLLEAGILGVFLSLDAFLFYVFFEAVLIPMYFIIGIWGGPRRLHAAIKFFLYTLTGSVLMLLGLLALYFLHFQRYGFYSFEIADLLKLNLALSRSSGSFGLCFADFAIKVPMFPFHTWLPDAHVEAPTGGSVVLASLLLKMGTYGFIRFSLPLLPVASADRIVVEIMAVLSIIAILYGALVSLMQRDWKKLIAYSSVSHMGFCTLGIFALNEAGLNGSVLQQLNHGITTGLLFLLVGMIYERRHTREIAGYGGVARVMPRFAVVFAIAAFASAGLPLLNGFVGEFTILQGVFAVSRVWAACAVLGIVLAAAYMLWLYQRTMLGEIRHEANRKLPDLNAREMWIVMPLVLWAISIGIYPKPYFDLLRRPVAAIVARVHGTPVP